MGKICEIEKWIFIEGKKLSIKAPIKLDRTYLSKPVVLNKKGNGVWAELATLAKFHEEGYDGVWLDTFHRKTWKSKDEIIEFDSLPKKIKEILGTKRGGRWDLIIWKKGKIKFVELKRISEDPIRPNQRDFMSRLLRKGFKRNNFLIVEWDYKK